MEKNKKMGFQAQKGNRVKRFNYIHINGDLHYCESHNFMYNSDEESKKLHNGEACYYTDNRFYDGDFNYFKSTYLHFSRYSKTMYGKSISLKAALRKVKNCKGIPKNTIVEFNQDWHIGKQDHSYLYKNKEYHPVNINYEVNSISFHDNFKCDEKMKSMVDLLRKNGFLVAVYNTNPGYLIGENPGEFAIAYGHGKRVGFSSNNDTFRGYSNGEDNVLWDKYGEFDKWSRCYEIPKQNTINEILMKLINDEE